MTLEVIGAGFGRTGTSSLKAALEILGFGPCYHMSELARRPEDAPIWRSALRGETVDWDRLFREYRAALDWPTCTFWRELVAFYPDAKVVLTVRDPERWYESFARTVAPFLERARSHAAPEQREQLDVGHDVIVQRTFQGRMDDRGHVIDVYRRHVAEVRSELSVTRCLVFDPVDEWPPLCEFLGRPVPSEPYPHANASDEFWGLVAAATTRRKTGGARGTP